MAPDVTLDIRPIGYRDVLDMLDGDGVDLAVTGLIEGGERFKTTRIMEDDYVAVLDANHPLAHTDRLTPLALAEFPHIAINSKGDDASFVDETLEEHGLRRKIAARVPFLSIALMLIGSKRVAVISRRIATDLAGICAVVVKNSPLTARVSHSRCSGTAGPMVTRLTAGYAKWSATLPRGSGTDPALHDFTRPRPFRHGRA